MQFVFPISQTKRYRFPTHINDLVVDRADSQTSEVFIVILKPGEAPPLHKHHDTEQVFYVLDGDGVLRIGRRQNKFTVRTGNAPAKNLCVIWLLIALSLDDQKRNPLGTHM
jgi:mannose-6-phosphate isomerase-like protein (cupin superfamily)